VTIVKYCHFVRNYTLIAQRFLLPPLPPLVLMQIETERIKESISLATASIDVRFQGEADMNRQAKPV
jgi:hypothetical protein